MEAVEDIPGTALHEGIPWGWETFGQYLDTIDTPYSVDIGAQIPHVALRYYVMGDRCYEDATADDIARMAELSRQALADGALGFSTSRFYGHRNKWPARSCPARTPRADEMIAIGEALRDSGHGTMEIISDLLRRPRRAVVGRAHRPSHRPAGDAAGDGERRQRAVAHGVTAGGRGHQIRPQVGPGRPRS